MSEKRKYKILFVMRATTHFHYYRSIVEAVMKKGYEVLVLFERFGEQWSRENYLEPIDEVRKNYPKFNYGKALSRGDYRGFILRWVRSLLNYHHNLNFKNQPRFFRDRSLSTFNPILKILLKLQVSRLILRRAIFGKFFRFVEKSIRPDYAILNHLKEIAPDVLVAPAGNVIGNSADIEYTKAASALGIKTAIPVISWDFLTTKGTIHIIPDRLFCWNEFHKEEALTYHHFPAERIRIIGAPVFDKWLSIINRKPALDREAFAQKYGMRPEDPFIIYLGSTANVAADESWVVREMRAALNQDPELAKIQIIVRPHPAHWKIYESLKDLPDIKIIPEIGGVMPDRESSLELFYETLYHSAAASGINTSGMIDAMMAGKPLVTMIVERYRSRQEKTAYFQQLLESNSSYLAKSGKEFAVILKELLGGEDRKKIKREEFIKNALRPRGINISAGEVAAMEIEDLFKEKI